MATLFVTMPLDQIAASERSTLVALSKLDDSWSVFHSVVWQSMRNGRQGDGEADFIVMHPHHGLLVLEVKGGDIAIDRGRWYSTNEFNQTFPIKNPFDQAKDSKYCLLAYFSEIDDALKGVPVNHAVVFPKISIDHGIGTYGPRDLIVDRRDLSDIESAVTRIFRHWGKPCRLSTEQRQRVESLLAPTVKVRVTLRDRVDQTWTKLIELTQQQIGILSQIRLMRRALILGGAGTGKTVLAMERVRRLSSDGFRSLLVCYNELLAKFMSSEIGKDKNIRVSTFHSLCVTEAMKAGLFIPENPNQEWWESESAAVCINAASKNRTEFDAVVVDEGQDFATDWLAALLLLSDKSKDSPFYVFADTHQDLYRRGWELPEDWPTFMLGINCRNSLPIAKRVSNLFGDEVESLGAEGPDPVFHIERSASRQGIGVAQNLVIRLMNKEKLEPHQIVVLTDSPDLVRKLRTQMAGDHCFTSPGRKGIVVESIRRFKGLEADVVVAILTDAILSDVSTTRSLAYVGLSRARSALFVIGSKEVRDTVNWLSRV